MVPQGVEALGGSQHLRLIVLAEQACLSTDALLFILYAFIDVMVLVVNFPGEAVSALIQPTLPETSVFARASSTASCWRISASMEAACVARAAAS